MKTMKPLTAPSYAEEAQSFPSLGISEIGFSEAVKAKFTKKNAKAGKLAYKMYLRRLQHFATSKKFIGVVSILVCVIWLAMIITTIFFV